MMAKHEARLLKKELMKRWPDVEFSLIGRRGTGRDHYSLYWKDGPTLETVHEVSNNYREGIKGIHCTRIPTCD